MYADRRSPRQGLDPRSAAIALVVNGAAITALIFAAPEMVTIRHNPPLSIYPVPIDPPPEPLPLPKSVTRASPAPHPVPAPIPIVPSIPRADLTPTPFPPSPEPTSDGTGMATGMATVTPTPTPMPPLVGPQLDPRYVRDLQPDYPPEETRASRQGRVIVRVLVGVDGRVRQVEKTSATSDAFWRATQRQALSHWRFTPATRSGVPEEAWRTMAISFVLQE
ncbi:energy transducer TonB [uncultured Sphingomonas sp.]|uniref:energy transducer TonB n=1 Tax=uncultured Sphingomonas sp. TaxID=158754 RepID=UPI0035C97B34